jgi:site-specific DNA recombinase
VAETIMRALKESDAIRAKETEERLLKLQEKQRNIQATIDKAYDDKLNGRITEEYWLTRYNQWQEDLALLRVEIGELSEANEGAFETADQILKLCQNAPELYVKQTYEEQARLLRTTHSNSLWDGVTLTAVYRKPFDILAEGLKSSSGGADETRTSETTSSSSLRPI